MQSYLSEDFLLTCDAARVLYHGSAEKMPVVDYHNHLSPRSIAEDAGFGTITKLWIDNDHYKWRLMRANGIDEQFITGDATDEDKFIAWADTVSRAMRNPLFDWANLELKRFFGISGTVLSATNAKKIYAECNEQILEKRFSARNLLRSMNVAVACTTDDPVDDLAFHAQLKRDRFEIAVLPTWRPDKALAVENAVQFPFYIDALQEASGIRIDSWEALLEALCTRHAFFHDHGCRGADFSIATMPFEPCGARELDAIFKSVRAGKAIGPVDCARYRTALMRELCHMNHKRGWVQQFHFGVIRNPRARLLKSFGPDSGTDCMGDFSDSLSLARFLNDLDTDGRLAKTVLYNINPRDNELFASLAGSFQDGSVPGKMQLGPAWWFMDHKDGILRHLNALSNNGLLSRFIGMTTDSRSLLSFVRHEYFRRILCNCVGEEMERGELPDDRGLMGGLVRDICFNNSARYFSFPVSNQAEQEKT